MKRVRWGVMGTAGIAMRRAIPAIKASSSGEVAAISSRDAAKAEQAAAEHGIAKAYAGYDALLADDAIDAIYIPLPNDLHLPWTLKAARAGKHVLCEKPLGLTADEVRQIQDVAKETGRLITEGVASHYHPVHERVAELIGAGAVGRLCFIRVSLGWSFQGKREDFRWQKAQGGGGLYDLGCYCLAAARRFAGSQPQSVVAYGMFDPETDIDTNMAITLRFPSEVTALIDCGILSATRNHYEVIGTTGRISVELPFGNGATARTLRVYDLKGNVEAEETLDAHQLELQFETVSRAILEGAPAPISLDESLANAEVLDACMISARAGGRSIELARPL